MEAQTLPPHNLKNSLVEYLSIGVNQALDNPVFQERIRDEIKTGVKWVNAHDQIFNKIMAGLKTAFMNGEFASLAMESTAAKVMMHNTDASIAMLEARFAKLEETLLARVDASISSAPKTTPGQETKNEKVEVAIDAEKIAATILAKQRASEAERRRKEKLNEERMKVQSAKIRLQRQKEAESKFALTISGYVSPDEAAKRAIGGKVFKPPIIIAPKPVKEGEKEPVPKAVHTAVVQEWVTVQRKVEWRNKLVKHLKSAPKKSTKKEFKVYSEAERKAHIAAIIEKTGKPYYTPEQRKKYKESLRR